MNKKYQVCLVPGTFICVHPGHIFLFLKAKEQCEKVIVVLAHDKRIKEKYSIEEETSKDREMLIKSIKYIDDVIIGEEKNFLKVLEEYRFDAVFTCSDHNIPNWVLDEIIRRGIKLEIIECHKKNIYSSRRLLKWRN